MSNGDAQRLEALNKALTAAPINKALTAAPIKENADLVSRIDNAVNACRVLGQEGRAIEETSAIFADQIEKMFRGFHDNISDRLTEMAKTVGRLGKPTPPVS